MKGNGESERKEDQRKGWVRKGWKGKGIYRAKVMG